MKRIALALLVLGAFASVRPVLAQGMPKPPPEMKKLDIFLGEWSGKTSFHAPGQPAMSVDSTMKSDAFAGGMYLRTVYAMDIPGVGKMEGTVLAFWDAEARQYRCYTFENAAPTPREESGTFAGNKLVLVSKPHGGTVTRSTFDFKSDREVLFTVEIKQGEKWVKAGRGLYTKKGG